jgi:hypothetical protein
MKDFFVEQIMSGFLITALPVAFIAGVISFLQVFRQAVAKYFLAQFCLSLALALYLSHLVQSLVGSEIN